MTDFPTMISGTTHQLYATLLVVFGRTADTDRPDDRDRGAVSLEQVLWFVAAGVSVAVIATILWNQIRDMGVATIRASPSEEARPSPTAKRRIGARFAAPRPSMVITTS